MRFREEGNIHENTISDLDAEHYRQHSSFQIQVGQELLDEIKFRGDEIILDVGCGDGRITAALSKRVPKGKAIGVDPSSMMIELAISSFPSKDLPNLLFQKMTAEELQIDEQSDIILILNALHWIRNPKKALQRIYEALKPGGTLLVLTYPKESPYWKLLENTLEKESLKSFKPQSASKTIISSLEYKKMLEELGFSVDCCSLEDNLAAYETSKELSDYIKGWLHCFVPLPSTLESIFLNEASKIASAQYLDTSSKEICIPYSKLIIKARK